MNRILILFLTHILYGNILGQCTHIRYAVSASKYLSNKDSIVFSAKTYCKRSQYVLFSLEYKESFKNWLEIDNDIFSVEDKQMKIIKLIPQKIQKFTFHVNSIDPVFLKDGKRVEFRIVSNEYSEDRIQILRIKVVKDFFLVYEKYEKAYRKLPDQ